MNGTHSGEKGSATLFAAAIMLAVVIFFCALVDGTRLIAEKSMVRDAGRLAMNGVMASYNRELKNAYGLFAFDERIDLSGKASGYLNGSTFGNRAVSAEGSGLATFFRASGRAAVSVSVPLSSGTVFEDQICDYVKYYTNVLMDREQLLMGMDRMDGIAEAVSALLQLDRSISELRDRLLEIDACLEKEESPGDAIEKTVRAAARMEADENSLRDAVGKLPDDSFRTCLESRLGEAEGMPLQRIRTVLETLAENGDLKESWDELKTELRLSQESEVYDTKASEDAAKRLKKTAEAYGEYAEVSGILSDGRNRDLLLSEYIKGMFSSFKSRSFSISGNNYYTGSTKKTFVGFEREYILYGNPSLTANIDRSYQEIQDYVYFWALYELLSSGTETRSEALSGNRTPEGGLLENYLFEDGCLLVKAQDLTARRTADREDHGMICRLYFGEGYVDKTYDDFLDIFTAFAVRKEKAAMLGRIRTLIETDMRNAGHPAFSFDTAYTAADCSFGTGMESTFFPSVGYSFELSGSY